MLGQLKNYLSLIKFSHTIFALPFALVGCLLAVRDEHLPLQWSLLVKVILCMVFARSAAMAFNRYADREFDKKNPRTFVREIPSGIISPQSAMAFVIFNCLAFMACAWSINMVCFVLSPLALAVILGYSYTKRFTPLCHLVLGLGLALAPIGAYLAIAGHFALAPLLMASCVLFWVAGFDIIYALQDIDFDKSQQLLSIPVLLGKKKALALARVLHVGACLFLFANAMIHPYAWLNWLGTGIFSSLVIYQHSLVSETDLSKVNLAFFTTNGLASLAYALFFAADQYFIR
ncbi:MAG: UbiA-like polyprenyltransferase [Bacteroidota bacterium]|jgi:4-hydroxybenzoate polyprenyltransferase